MARKYHCCSRNDTFIASGSSEKTGPPLQLHPPHPYFRASRSTEKSRKNQKTAARYPTLPYRKAQRKPPSAKLFTCRRRLFIIYFSAVQFTKEGHPGGQKQRILSPPLLLPHAATPLSDGQRMHKACIIPLVQLPSTCQQRLQHLRMGLR